jgi:hypothetical protein
VYSAFVRSLPPPLWPSCFRPADWRRIAEGNFYEAHQQLRAITSRYLKASVADYASACDVLYNGSLLLLRAGHGGSGGDLALMLLNDVYNKGELECNGPNKSKLLEILRAFPPVEPTRKRFVSEMVGWSAKMGELERGDPDIHHEVGKVYAEGEQEFNFLPSCTRASLFGWNRPPAWFALTQRFPSLLTLHGLLVPPMRFPSVQLTTFVEGDAYDAERHLVLGTADSAPVLASLHYTWYRRDQPHLAAIYASRSVLPYLIVGNLQSANLALQTFTSHLTTTNPQLLAMSQPLESGKSGLSLRIFPSIPLLNFLSLLLLACQKADAGLFRQLAKYYAPHLKDAEGLWSDALANVGEIWFGIRIPRQGGNPLMDMMGSMLFGGGGGGAPAKTTPKLAPAKAKEVAPPPPTVDLD